jgi:lysophospholipase L1-like esterase
MFRWLLGICFALTGLGMAEAQISGPARTNRFEAEIQKFEQADSLRAPAADSVLFVGSSSIRKWTNLASAFPDWTVLNRGFGGSTLADVDFFFDRVIRPYRPRVVVLYEGDNDLAQDQTVEQLTAQFEAFLDRLATELPGTSLVMLAVKPSPKRRSLLSVQQALNHELQRLARTRSRAIFVDTFSPLLNENQQPDPQWFESDQLHLNPAGYARWVPVVRAALQQATPQPRSKSP